tara:strand:+ start:867 stop:1118 length:252 start_codon:yes stop_codon:yes gene_type:complete
MKGYSCYDPNHPMPVAAAIERILRDTGDIDKARYLFAKAVLSGVFKGDGYNYFAHKVACIELLQLAELGYKDFQPQPTNTETA